LSITRKLIVFTWLGLMILGFSLCNALTASAADSPAVNAGVVHALAAGGRVPVLIKLKDPDHPVSARSATKSRIRNLQKRFADAFSPEELAGDVVVHRRLARIPWISATISSRALERLRRHRFVAVIEADVPIRAQLAESAPLITADRSFQNGYSGLGVNVAVLDSGIDTDHPDLLDSLVWEECFLTGRECPVTGTSRASGPGSAEDDAGHGSHVSGIITSDNENFRGIAADAGIVAIKLLDSSGNGSLSDLIAAIDWVADNHQTHNIRVINMSLGGSAYEGYCDDFFQSLADASEAARDAGIVLFAASGNDGFDTQISVPACLSSIISVGAVYDADVGYRAWSACADPFTAVDQIACFSNVSTVLDMLAPGALIDSMDRFGATTTKSGTSMACPHAAAAAALLLESNPSLSPDEVLASMTSTGTGIYDDRIDMWFPRIDTSAALGIDVHTAPFIDAITPSGCISELATAAIVATASDPAGGTLTHAWDALDGGTVIGSGPSVLFDPPDAGPHPCPYRVCLTLTSPVSGLSTQHTIDITVKLAGDVDSDGTVNILDKVAVRNAFGASGPAGTIPADVNADGVVNILDKVIVRNQFGQDGCGCD
jgi:hypothetical protein